MYTLLELESKTFGALKKIGEELNLLPKGDRRCRQSWIDALVTPPLLQLLEASPAVSVEHIQEPIEVQAQEPPLESKFGRIVYPRPAQEPIAQPVETAPGVEVDRAQEPIELVVETSPGVSVEQVHKAIEPVAENSPGVEVDRAQEPIMETVETSPTVSVEQVQKAIEYGRITGYLCRTGYSCRPVDIEVKCPRCGAIPGLFSTKDYFDRPVIGCMECDYGGVKSYPGAIKIPVRETIEPVAETSPAVSVEQVQEPIEPVAETSPAVSVEQVQEPIEQAAENSPGVEVDRVQEPIMETAENSPAVSVEQVQEAISQAVKTSHGVNFNSEEFRQEHTSEIESYFKSFEADRPLKRGDDGRDRLENEPRMSKSAIAQAVENSPGVDCLYCHSPEYQSLRDESYRCYKCQPHETDLNPILTGIVLSDRFLARYSPPQSEIHYKADTDGQLSLLDFEIESADEPPDPDDFESLDAFPEAIARWDWEHPSSSDHCSDQLPSSEDNDVSSEDNDVSSEDKPLELSLDSFCLWAHCPADWYEPATLLDPSKVMELSPVHKNSSTSDFFIPTFGRLGDRSNRSDEPPDTGIFTRLPKPKPPTFPPQAASQPQVSPSQPKSAQVNQASRNYPETIPKLFHCIVAGSSTQPARSPPGGDARRGQ
jgi:hypothetical protein